MAKKKKMSFRGKVSRNFEKKEKEGSKFSYLELPEGVQQFKPEPYLTRLDIIPYIVTDEHHLDRDDEYGDATPGEVWWKKPFKVHKNIGVDEVTLVCPTTLGKKCPICEEVKEMRSQDVDWEEIEPLMAKDRSLYAIIPVNTKKYDEDYSEDEIYVFDMSYHLFEKLLKEEVQVDEEFEDFPNLEGGKTIAVRFREKKFGKATYCEAAKVDFEDREEDYTEEILEEVPDLDSILKVLPYEEIKQLFLMQDDEEETRSYKKVDDEEDQEEEKKVSRKKKSTFKKKPDPDIEPEDDEEDQEEEEEKEKKPTQSKSKPTRSKTSSTKSKKGKCPHGYEFGVDTDENEECEDCEIWDSCIEEKEGE